MSAIPFVCELAVTLVVDSNEQSTDLKDVA